MAEDMLMMLLRVAIIVFPAGFACFIAGFLYGRGTAYRHLDEWSTNTLDGIENITSQTPPVLVEPVHYATRLTSRNNTLEF